MVFAKKAKPSTMNDGFYEADARSFTKGTVSKFRVAKDLLTAGEKVLIIDDFMAHGEASMAPVSYTHLLTFRNCSEIIFGENFL